MNGWMSPTPMLAFNFYYNFINVHFIFKLSEMIKSNEISLKANPVPFI